jgi:LCP family protein required for cell wall assembly
MNDWPDGYGRGSQGSEPESARVMRHVQRRPVPQQSHGYDEHQRSAAPYDSGYNTGQVYGTPSGTPSGNPPGRPPRPPGPPSGPRGSQPYRQPPNWGRRIKIGSLVLVVAFAAVTIGTYFGADSKVRRGDCTTYLIVGSDSREGMTSADKKRLRTGSAEGTRTDSMMILADCSSGATMISLPRDSDVEIPSFKGSESGKFFPNKGRRVKLNAAYAEDGPELLVRTVEHNTGLRIDHYAEIGFAGFANIVDAIGGVEMDIPKAFKDKKSGADFQAGKQTLDGEQALAFVRTRYAFAESDLARTKNQQKFLAALASQTATPGTILNPFKLYPVMGAGLDTLIVDTEMSLWDLGSMFFAMKGITGGDGTSLNMPISGSRGGNLVWDKAKVNQLVKQIENDEKVTVTGN